MPSNMPAKDCCPLLAQSSSLAYNTAATLVGQLGPSLAFDGMELALIRRGSLSGAASVGRRITLRTSGWLAIHVSGRMNLTFFVCKRASQREAEFCRSRSPLDYGGPLNLR
jgi:hypothetical protein